MRLQDIPEDIEPRVGDIIEIEQGDVCFEVRIIGITADGYLCEQDNVEGAVLLEGVSLAKEDASDIEDFLRSGGKIQQLPYKNTRKEKSAHHSLASRHIGGAGREQSKGKLAGLRGRAAAVNVSGTGKAVVGEDCWDGYKQEGMKKKGDRMVPNCVPESQEAVEESGLQYYTGVKKHGAEYMKRAAKAGREGASQEELGRLRDRYSKAEKNKNNLKEFSQDGGGNAGDFLLTLARAWYMNDIELLAHIAKTNKSVAQGMISGKVAVEKLLARGVVGPDGKVRKYEIDFTPEFDGVVLYTDDYFEHSDYGPDGKMVDGRTGKPWGPYEFISFSDEQLGESVAEAGPFSYGYKKPRKGSVAYWAEKKRKEQEKGKPPIEPKDQMVGVAKVTKAVAEGIESQYMAARYIDEFGDGDHWYVKGTPDVIKKFVLLANSLEDEAVKGTEYEPGKGMMAGVHAELGNDAAPQWTVVPARNLESIKPIGDKVLQRLMRPNLADGAQEFMSELLWAMEEKGLALVTDDSQQGVAEGYTGRETKDGTWRVFKDGQAVAVAGPFNSRDEAHAWIKKHKQGVSEAKSLKKRVRVVQGEHAGKTGWIREIKHGTHSTAPKRYYVDIDGGGQANNLPASALRLLKDQSDGQKGMAEATGDTKFDAMMGNIKKSAPVPVSGYVAVEYASENQSDRIKGVTLKGKPMPSSVDVDDLEGEIEFQPDEIERHLIKIGRDNGWSIIDPGHGRGYSELFFDTNANYTSDNQSILAKNIVNTVNQINKFFSGLNSSLQSTGLPGYKVSVWQEISSPNGQKIGDINQIKQIALTKVVHSPNDPGELIGQAILRELPAVEQDEYDDFTPEDFAYARKIAKIYITKGERAGLKAQISNRRMDHVSDLIDELLSLSGAQKYRTLKLDDLDEQSMAEGEQALNEYSFAEKKTYMKFLAAKVQKYGPQSLKPEERAELIAYLQAQKIAKENAGSSDNDQFSLSGKMPATDLIPQDSTAGQDKVQGMVARMKQQTIDYILDAKPEWERSDLELMTAAELNQILRDIQYGKMTEAEYQGRKVPLGKPMAGDVKKSKVYVRKPNGRVVKVNFGDKNMTIKKSNPKRRKSFRARHNCANPGPRWKARYWSCRAW